jgi:hypothetical protein
MKPKTAYLVPPPNIIASPLKARAPRYSVDGNHLIGARTGHITKFTSTLKADASFSTD